VTLAQSSCNGIKHPGFQAKRS